MLGAALLVPVALGQVTGDGEVRVLTLRDMINPVSERYLVRGMETAADEGAALVVIELDTPDGLLDATQSLTAAMLGQPGPRRRLRDPAGHRGGPAAPAGGLSARAIARPLRAVRSPC